MERIFEIASGIGMSLRDAQAAGWEALAVECAPCGLTSYISIWALMKMTRLGFVEEVAGRMHCRFCRASPSAFYLVRPTVREDPFKHMVFHVEEWLEGGRKPVQLISASMNVVIAHSAFDEALNQYPRRPLVLREKAYVIRTNFDFDPPPSNVVPMEPRQDADAAAPALKRRRRG